MDAIIIDTNEIKTSVGTFKRTIEISRINDFGCGVATTLYFDGIEYDDVKELKFFLGDEAFDKMKSEVEDYSSVLDFFMQAFPSMRIL